MVSSTYQATVEVVDPMTLVSDFNNVGRLQGHISSFYQDHDPESIP